MTTVDVVVIGGGPAGETVAGRCAEGGLEVVLVEHQLVGGECSYWGCMPSKTLLRPGDVLAAARRVPGAAAAVTGAPDVAAALARRDWMTGEWTDAGQLPWLTERGIRLVRGRGRVAGDRTVAVERDGQLAEQLQARRAVVLATGTTAALPPIPGLAEAQPWDNRGATAAKAVPRRLLVLGGGAIGCEMAQAFRRLGAAQVTVVEASDRLLPAEEPFAGREVAAAFAAEGIAVRTGVRMTAVRRDRTVTATLDDGSELDGDELLVAVGRRAATPDGRFVTVDERFRVDGSDWLYAVGDCNGRALLTHMGKYQARLAAEEILGGADEVAVEVVPRVTFTDPQVCAVGPTTAQARARGLDPIVVTHPLAGVPAAATLGEAIAGTGQLVIADDRVVGATFTGPAVAELLHSATVAIVGAVPVARLRHAVPSFPTLAEVWLHLLDAHRRLTSGDGAAGRSAALEGRQEPVGDGYA